MTQEKKDPLIRGDKLLLAFQCIENTYARHLARIGDDWDGRVWDSFVEEALNVEVSHRFGSAHWFGQIALCAPTRATLARTMGEASRRKSFFHINVVAAKSIRAVSNRNIMNGLSRTDRRKIRDRFTRFLCLVAAGVLDEHMLRKA